VPPGPRDAPGGKRRGARGSAIIGPARADIYFGAGDEAGRIGGRIKQPARFVMLVPREIDPFEKWRNVPMPPIKGEEREVAAEPEPAPVAAATPKGSKKPAAKTGAASAAKKTAAREVEAKSAPKRAAKPAQKTATKSNDKPKDEPSGLRRLLGLSKPDPKPAKKKKASGDRS
jgi:membrane-bound lytic murein transglycosylase A